MGRKIAQELIGGEGQKQFGEIFAALEHPQRGAHTTGNRKFDQGLQFCRAGHTDMYWQGDAIGRKIIGPVNHRCLKMPASSAGPRPHWSWSHRDQYLCCLQDAPPHANA